MQNNKNLDVIVHCKTDGSQHPIAIIWYDGRKFEIDRVLEIKKCASLKTGGRGIRYTCIIRNRQIYLFQDEDKWFLE